MFKQAIDRRTVLKGAAASTVAAAMPAIACAEEAVPQGDALPVSGYMCAEDWLGEAPVIGDEQIVEELTADVVVCGLGHAGSNAVLAAAQAGASVIGIEVQPEDMFSCFGDDICSYNSAFLTEKGFGGYDTGELVAEYIRRGAGRVNPDIISSFIVNSGEMMDNFIAVTPETSNMFDLEGGQCQVQIAYGMPDASYYPIERGGFKAWATTVQTIGNKNEQPVCGREGVSRLTEIELYVQDAAKKLGADLRFETAATVLIQNEEGDVTGVIADGPDGYIKINANKGVILCTGDFSGNADMVWNLLDDVNEVSIRNGATRDQLVGRGRNGVGHKMGCWAGGVIESHPRPSMNTNGGNPGPWGTTPFLLLNNDGKRFMNECMAGFMKPTILRQPNGIIACVTDANYMAQVRNAGLDHGAPNFGQAGVDAGFFDRLDEEMQAVLGTGAEGANVGGVGIINVTMQMGSTVYAAETLEELLGYLGYEGESLEAALTSIEAYNELCRAGVDTQYGKDAIALQPIEEPPFYGSVSTNTGIGAAGLVCLAGLVTDGQQNVLKADYSTPIKGLYAAGNCLGHRFGPGYSTPSAGASMGMAMTHGRVAGKIVAAL